jgi:hypothetical protein
VDGGSSRTDQAVAMPIDFFSLWPMAFAELRIGGGRNEAQHQNGSAVIYLETKGETRFAAKREFSEL